MRWCLFISFGLVLLFESSLVASFYDRKAEGWHWYEESNQWPVISNQKKSELSKEKMPDPIAQLESFKKEVERLKAIAILTPSYGNVKAYMEIQKKLMAKASLFSEKWLEVVFTTPHLDAGLRFPTAQAARHVYLDQKQAQKEAQIKALAKTYGLFFFYSSTCAYCQKFAPLVKGFSEKYHWKVLPISLDGKFLPEFPDSKRDNGAAKALKVTFVPTLLAVDLKSGKTFPLSHGLSTHDQIEERIRVLLVKRKDL